VIQGKKDYIVFQAKFRLVLHIATKLFVLERHEELFILDN
jgi:hypothetical protein